MKEIINRVFTNYKQNKIQWIVTLLVTVFLAFWNTLTINNNQVLGFDFLNFFIYFVLANLAIYLIRRFVLFIKSNNKEIPTLKKLFSRRIYLLGLLVVTWGIILIPFFPVITTWDSDAMISEFFSQILSSVYHAKDINPVYNLYPVGHYLITNSSVYLTNHHNLFLEVIWGTLVDISVKFIGGTFLGFVFIGVSQFLLTVYGFAHSLFIFGNKIKSDSGKLIFLLIVIVNPLIIFSSITLSKNPTFAAAFVLFVSLIFEFIFKKGQVSIKWYIATILSVTVQLISVKWAVYVLLIGLLFLIFQCKEYWKKLALSCFVPIILFEVLLQGLFASRLVIKDDPIDSMGVQLSQIALYLKRYPSDISKTDKYELNKIIDVENFPKLYQSRDVGPLQSVAAAPDSLGYRYTTVTALDMKSFYKIWFDLFEKHPSVYFEAFFAKNNLYFSLGSKTDFGIWNLEATINKIANTNIPLPGFESRFPNVKSFIENIMTYFINNKFTNLLLSSAFFNTVLLLFIPLLISRRKKLYWLAFLLMAQVGVLLISPLNGDIRYTLGVVYIAPVLLGLLFVEGKRSYDE